MKPRVLLSVPHQEIATFFWENTPGLYVAYRMFEHDPQALEAPLPDVADSPSCSLGGMPSLEREKLQDEDADPLLPNMVASYVEKDSGTRVQLSFQAFADGTAWCGGQDNRGAQRRELFFEPVEDGVLMWMRLTTHEPIPGPFVVAQCLQFGGETSMEHMKYNSLAPMFSEFDSQAHWNPNKALTRARKDGRWIEFPVQHTRCQTPRGLESWPYRAWTGIDHGLVIRESLDGECASGMYWEQTAWVSNRHPADCVHSFVDFGPLEAGQSRTVHGKFYFVKGGKGALLDAWRRDFPISNPDM